MLGTYGFVPQRHRPFKKLTKEEEAKVAKAIADGKKIPTPKRISLATMNARAEEVGSKVTYKKFWLAQQLCIVPAWNVFEPNWETGAHVRWAVEKASTSLWGCQGCGGHGRRKMEPSATASLISRLILMNTR